MRRSIVAFSLFFLVSLYGHAQSWSGILNSGQAIDWSNAGVGGIPARTTNCASLTSTASLSQINSALASCASGQTVYLAAGTYNINGTIQVPSNVTLRGAGADQTILNATGGSGYVVALGSGGAPYSPNFASITSGATNGSTSIAVSSASGISTGGYMVVTENNNAAIGVTNQGTEGACSWCDGTSASGNNARGQIVKVMSVSGSTITFSPGLYGAYTNSPKAYPLSMSASYAGVENLQVYANNTGYDASFGMDACAYCWVKGVESNYTDGDYVHAFWGYHDEVRDSYFSNAYTHGPGSHDSEIDLALKTSASLVENNIIERTHVAIMFEWGSAGNVASYNFMQSGFDTGATNVVIGGITYHGAHPQYNLLEGNVGVQIYLDSVWGSSSDTTAFRNWVQGSSAVSYPESDSRSTVSGGSTVGCTSLSAGHTCYPFQASRAFQISQIALRSNLIGNVVGSAAQQSNAGFSGGVSSYNSGAGQTDALQWPTTRVYDTTVYGYTFGYGEAGDDGSGGGDSTAAYTTSLLHGNYGNISGTVLWNGSLSHTLPPSFYLPSKPSWWNSSVTYPAIGPDVTGANGPGGHASLQASNPAQFCYFTTMGGVAGGSGSPKSFNASTCYGGASVSSGPVPASPTNLTGTVK